MTTVYRADTVGSLLRPDYLVRARAQYESGELAPTHYKEIEDRAVDQVIAMQEGAGMDVVTDGELRRHTFIDQLLEAVVGSRSRRSAGSPLPALATQSARTRRNASSTWLRRWRTASGAERYIRTACS
jgi:methionine synthase II (cobalamin-independent)